MRKIFYSLLLVLTTSFFFAALASETVTPWGNYNVESFMSYKTWREQSDLQLQFPEWKDVVQARNHREMVGRVYQCIGSCRIDRGEGFFNSAYRSAVYEGDEIQTLGDSYIWIFLFDGTMVRLSPRSSITFNELNVGVKENFISARINVGNVLWLSRHESEFTETNLRETDVVFFPYSEYESLPKNEKSEYIEEDLLELFAEKKVQLKHYKDLNERIIINNKLTKNKPTYAFLVMPNATIMGMSPSVEMVTLIGGKSYFKKRSRKSLGQKSVDEIPEDIFLQIRGYENKNLTTIQEDLWISIDEKGRSFADASDMKWLDVSEFITKRIPSIMIGREIFLSRYSEFVFNEKARSSHYRLWGKLQAAEGEKKSDLELRLEFLKEYFRRVETSNLLASEKLRERLQGRGERGLVTEYGDYFFSTALNRYYKYGEILKENSNDKETGEVLNSTKKLLWKKMHGIR